MSARVTLERRRLWSVRASRAIARWLLCALALAGIAASVRSAIAPAAPRTVAVVSTRPTSDAAAQWFALQFARAYLTWTADASLRERALAPFLGAGQSAAAGAVAAPGGAEHVRSVAIADEHAGAVGNESDYTVAATVDSGAVRYLMVAVQRGPGGGEQLARYPALVGAPTPVPSTSLDGSGLPSLAVPALAAVLDRALRNYLAGSGENLAADLAVGARVTPVAPGLSFAAVARLAVEPTGGVLATVLVADAGGETYTLSYEVSVVELGGRWEITDIGP